jgi:ribosome maturation protein SDO1
MSLKIILSNKDGKRLKDKLVPLIAETEDEDWGEDYELVCSMP